MMIMYYVFFIDAASVENKGLEVLSLYILFKWISYFCL
jgi:1-deoxy-D-xylulose 5-phosphate reductoisomerase